MKVGTTLIPDLWRMASSEAAVEWMGVLPTSAQEKTNLVERAPSGRDVGDDLLDLGRCESGPAVLVRAHDPVVAELANTLVVVVCAGVEKDHSPVISTAVAVGPQ
jgi:hypothetical protein